MGRKVSSVAPQSKGRQSASEKLGLLTTLLSQISSKFSPSTRKITPIQNPIQTNTKPNKGVIRKLEVPPYLLLLPQLQMQCRDPAASTPPPRAEDDGSGQQQQQQRLGSRLLGPGGHGSTGFGPERGQSLLGVGGGCRRGAA